MCSRCKLLDIFTFFEKLFLYSVFITPFIFIKQIITRNSGTGISLNPASYFYNSVRTVLKTYRFTGLLLLKETTSEFGYYIYDVKSKQFIFSYIMYIAFYLPLWSPWVFSNRIQNANCLTAENILRSCYLLLSLLQRIALITFYRNLHNILKSFDAFGNNLITEFRLKNRKYFENDRSRDIGVILCFIMYLLFSSFLPQGWNRQYDLQLILCNVAIFPIPYEFYIDSFNKRYI